MENTGPFIFLACLLAFALEAGIYWDARNAKEAKIKAKTECVKADTLKTSINIKIYNNGMVVN